MSASHGVGSAEGLRQGCIPIVHSMAINFDSTVNQKFLSIKASPSKPVLLQIRELGITAFNAGTLNQYRLGTASAGAQILALRNTPAANGNAEPIILQWVFTDRFQLWVGLNLTGTAPTAGKMYLTATLTELNTTDVDPQD